MAAPYAYLAAWDLSVRSIDRSMFSLTHSLSLPPLCPPPSHPHPQPCHEAHPHDMTYQLWSRIMLFEDSMHHKGVLPCIYALPALELQALS